MKDYINLANQNTIKDQDKLILHSRNNIVYKDKIIKELCPDFHEMYFIISLVNYLEKFDDTSKVLEGMRDLVKHEHFEEIWRHNSHSKLSLMPLKSQSLYT